MAHLGTIKRKTQSVHKPKVDTNILSTTIKIQNKKNAMQKLGKKKCKSRLAGKKRRVERVETHFKDDKNQAGRQKAEDDDDFNENPRVPQEFRVKRV